MTMISILQLETRDAYPALIAGVEAQFGRDGAVEIAARFLAAELADFHWQSRMIERPLGRYQGALDDEAELERIAIAGLLNGAWFAAICIVDGAGSVQHIQSLKLLRSAGDAQDAFEQAH